MPRRYAGIDAITQSLRAFWGVQNRRNRRRAGHRERVLGQAEACESRALLAAAGYVQNHVLLGLEPGASVEDLQSAYPDSEITPLGNYGIYLMTLPAGSDAMVSMSTIADRAEVSFAQPDWIGEWTAAPNDPDYNRLWGLKNTGQLVNGVTGTAGADIDAELAWDLTTGSTTVIAAIVDSGVDYGHPDLISNMWVNAGEIAGNGVDDDANGFVDDIHGYDFGSNDADPMDFVGHGTHVAGTVGAVGNNATGLTGVNWNVGLMALKIGTDLGGPTTSGAIGAINYAVDMGAAVSNHSYTVTPSAALQSAITYAQNNNHIVVVASGNSNRNIDIFPTYPASYTNDNVISVAATDQNDSRAVFSNYGVVSVDIGAPGTNIWSTTPRAGSLFYGPNYDYSDGTSMAAPHVTGAVALLRSVAPAVPYSDIIDAIYTGSDKIASMTGIVSTGGRLNVANALAQLQVASISVNPSSVREDAGASGASLTLQKLSWDINTPLTVDIAFDDDTEVSVPAFGGLTAGSVTIPAGLRQITIPIDILDDTLLDGTQTVSFTLSYGGNVIGGDTLNVADHETLSLTFDRDSVREDAGTGAANLTLTRSNTDVFPPNVFVTLNNDILEYDNSGVLINTIPVPWPTGVRPIGQNIHDLVTLANGRIAVYNGTGTGYISIYNPALTTWQHFFVPGLSTSAADPGTGGITSWGNYVFVTDMQDGPGNAYGAVRLDLSTGAVTRFAQKSLGRRLFVKDVHGSSILEIDPLSGATINSLPMPTANNFGFNNGMAFDGTNLWVLAGPIGNDQIYKLDADTGAVLDIHSLGSSNEYDGLAWVNGLLYAQDNFIQNQITVYDPVTRSIVRTLNVGATAGLDISGGLAGITGPDALIATSTFGDEIYELSTATGGLIRKWNSGMSTTEYGVGVAGGEIYVGEFIGGNIRVFNRTGVFQRNVTPVLTAPAGIFAIGGDDIEGLTATPYRYRDIASGLDDQLYVLDRDGLAVGRFDHSSLALDQFFNLSTAVNAIAVFTDGTIYGVSNSGWLYQFDSAGQILRSLNTGVTDLIDIDLNVGGQILISTAAGNVLRTNTQFAAVTSFSAGGGLAFVTSGRNQTQLAGELIVTITNSDTTELRLPGGGSSYVVVIPAGQQSVTIPVDALTDNLLDGTQTVTVSASHPSYVGTATDSIDVVDTEKVLVDVVDAAVSESAGPGGSTVRVSRTDFLGPYTSPNQQTHTVSTPQTILDRDTIISPIDIPSEYSVITDVNVTISLQHAWLGDLDVFLVSPQGTRVELFTDLVTNGTLMTSTRLDDQAQTSILSAIAPFTGSFMPEGTLSALNGQNPSGRWLLEVTDDNRLDTGTLLSWTLNFSTMGLAPLAVTLSSSDTTEATVPISVLIPANQRDVVVNLDAIDDDLLDGTQTVLISATGASLPALELGSDQVDVLDSELLTFTVSATTVSEAAGAAALTGRLTRFNSDIGAPLTVLLSSSDPSELSVPASVVIPAGSMFVDFAIDAVDDNLYDGDQLVTLTATAAAYGAPLTVDITVEDLEPSLGLTTLSTQISENAGFFQMTVTRRDQSDLSLPMTVALTSSDTTELTVPATVIIPAGAQSVSFNVTVINDTILETPQLVTITATAAGISDGTLNITVNDHETLTLTINKSSILENAGANAAEVTITRNNTDILNELVVTLTSSDTTELTVPATVTIPAGQMSTTFMAAAVNDPDVDGSQNVTITATAAGYVNGTVSTVVLDHEPPVISAPVSPTQNPRPTIVWNALSGATRYDIWIDNVSSGQGQILRNKNIPAGTTSYVPPESLGIGTYRAWVRAYDALELPGFWSEPYLFTINTAPTIRTPTNGTGPAATTLPVFSWTAVADAVRYDLWVDNLTTNKFQVIRQSNLTTTSFTPTTPLTSGSYRMWVRATNAQGETGLWSVARTFAVLQAPTVTAPTGGTFNRTPNFTWSAITSATHYDLWVSSNNTNQVVLRNQFVLGTSFRAPTDLPNGQYTVWVRAFNGASYSVWSAPQTFNIGLAPTVTSPTAGSTASARPQFAWTSLTETARYELWVDRVVNGVATRVIYQTALTSPTFTATSNLAAGSYRVWVRAISTMGVSTTWSTPVSFTVAQTSPQPAQGRPADFNGQVLLTSLTVNAGTATDDADAVPAWSSVQPASVDTAAETVETTPARSVAAATALPQPQSPVMSPPVATAATAAESLEEAVHDAVMAQWNLADWWATSEQEPAHDRAAQAGLVLAGMGLVLQQRSRREDRR